MKVKKKKSKNLKDTKDLSYDSSGLESEMENTRVGLQSQNEREKPMQIGAPVTADNSCNGVKQQTLY